MSWIVSSIISLFLWSGYSIFGDRATDVHGEKISLFFEMGALIVLNALIFLLWGGLKDFSKITTSSFISGSLMGLMSSGGLFFLLHALRTSPPHHFSTIVLITGLYPVVTAVIGHFFLDAKLSLHQWVGVGLAGLALWLINWER